MATRIPARLSAAEGRSFGLTLGGAFLVLGGIAWWRGRLVAATIFGTLGVLLVTAGLALPTQLRAVRDAWMGLGRVLAKITNPILLGLIFLVVITPVGLLMRLLGRRPLGHGGSQPSFWVARPADTRRRVDMEHQF